MIFKKTTNSILIFILIFSACNVWSKDQSDLEQIKTSDQKIIVFKENFEIHIFPDSLIQISKVKKQLNLNLISGSLYFKEIKNNLGQKPLVKTSYLAAEFSDGLFITAETSKVTLANFNKTEIILRLVDNSDLILLPGFLNWFSGFRTNSKVFKGMPKKIDSKFGVEVLSRVHTKQADLREAIVDFKKNWRAALNSEIEIYRSIASLKIEDEEKKLQAQALKQQKLREESENRRRLFFQNSFSK